MGDDIYREETPRNPKTDARLAHDPLPSMRIQNKMDHFFTYQNAD